MRAVYTTVRIVKKIFFVVVALFVANSCCSLDPYPEDEGVSTSVKESKNAGAFLAEYSITPNVIVVNDSITLRFNEAWIENSWWEITDKWCNTHIDVRKSSFQLIISADEPTVQAYDADKIRIFNSDISLGLWEHTRVKRIMKWESDEGRVLKELPDSLLFGVYICDGKCKLEWGKYVNVTYVADLKLVKKKHGKSERYGQGDVLQNKCKR